MKNRVKIICDGIKVFETSLVLNVNDMNYGNHLGNDRVLALAQEARLRWLESLAASELNCMGQSLIMSDAMVEYKGEGFRGDEVKITVYLGESHKYGFDLFYDMQGPRGPVAKVKSGLLFFDYEIRKVAQAPEDWIKYNDQLV
tara:strand:- start:13080 stop:13508 length:429 start_codon:yes stop_codon:yes gene_type:complete